MRTIAFFSPPFSSRRFLGDELCLKAYFNGLKKLGHNPLITSNLDELDRADAIFLGNILADLRPLHRVLKERNLAYGVVPFYANYTLYSPVMFSFCSTVDRILEGEMPLELLLEVPEIIRYTPFPPEEKALRNFEVIRDAKVCITASPTESRTILRDCPKANPRHIFLTPGMATGDVEIDSSFLNLTNLESGSYILQVGRIEIRKNQLATVLATRNIDKPLVLISSEQFENTIPYYEMVKKAILKYRKAPTYIISPNVQSAVEGSLHSIHVPEGLNRSQILSAFGHAGLYLHPAFTELPGYVYLEAAQTNTAIVASSWATASDYLGEGEQIKYTLPHHINKLESLAEQQFGKKFDSANHPVLKRTEIDLAEEFLTHTQESFNL